MSVTGNADYTISARIVAEDATASGADSASRRLTQVEGNARRVGMSISGTLARAFAVLGGAAGIGVAVRGMIGLNSEIQTAKVGLATLFSAMTGAGIGTSLGLARKEVQALQKDAAHGVGELTDYLAAFQGVLGPGLAAGKTTDQLRELTRNALAAGFALQGQRGLRNAPIDIQQALTSGAGDRITPIVSTALKAVGMTNEAFNKLTVAKRIDELNKAFGAFGPGVAVMGQTWEAQFSTLSDNVKNIIRGVSSPIFDRWTEGLRNVNAWLEKNADTMTRMVDDTGQKLLRLWDDLVSRGQSLARTFAPVAAGGMAANAATGLGGAAGAAGGAAGLAELVPVLAAVGLAGGAIVGAFRDFPTLAPQVAEAAMYLWGGLVGLGSAFATLFAEGSLFNLMAGNVIESLRLAALGFGFLLRVVDTAITSIGFLAQVLGRFAEVGAAWGRGMLGVLRGDAGAMDRELGGMAAFDPNGEQQRALRDIWGVGDSKSNGIFGPQIGPYGPELPQYGPELPPPASLRVPQSVTNIGTVNMNVKTEVNADPARVMTALGEGLDQVRIFGRGAKRTPSFGV